MKNIFWISSYPKSGNTFVRIFLSSYLFTKNGNFEDFKIINNIGGFNNIKIFKRIKNFCKKKDLIKDPTLISKYWIEAQKTIYELEPKKLFFFKTHNSQIKFRNRRFTNENFTRGFIYIVRDPRSVIVSAKHHYNYKNYEIGLEYLFSERHISLARGNTLPEFLLSWQQHYLSWKRFLKENPNLGLILRYEDLVNDPNKFFYKILNFINSKQKIEINEKKFNNALESTKFENLQNKESNIGFIERPKNAPKFFRKGITDEWKKEISLDIIKKIEKKYFIEMKELGYL